MTYLQIEVVCCSFISVCKWCSFYVCTNGDELSELCMRLIVTALAYCLLSAIKTYIIHHLTYLQIELVCCSFISVCKWCSFCAQMVMS